MATDPIAALDTAIAGLEAAFVADPNYVLLRKLIKARQSYGLPAKGAASSPVEAAERVSIPGGRKMNAERVRALELSRECLSGKKQPVTSKEINDFVVSKGCVLNGNAQNNLASLLLRHGDFLSHGRRGWTLKDHLDAVDNDGNGAATQSPEAADDLLSRSAPAASISSPGLTNGGTWAGSA